MSQQQRSKRFILALALPIVMLIVVALSMTNFSIQHVAANITGNLSDYITGWGCASCGSGLNDPTYLSKIDYVVMKIPLYKLEPSWHSIDWTAIDEGLDKAVAQGAKAIIGIKLREVIEDTPCDDNPSLNCTDDTPNWLLASSPTDYDPVPSTSRSGVMMLNYDNANVKAELEWLIDQITARYNSNSNVIYLVGPGIGLENGPAKPPERYDYENHWGGGGSDPEAKRANATSVWLNYVKWYANYWNSKASGAERIFNVTYHFFDSSERDTTVPYVMDLSSEWGIYGMHVTNGLNRNGYRLDHTWDEIYDTTFVDEVDTFRNLCRTRPCYAEHSWGGGSIVATEPFQYWQMLSALWQGLDGYDTLYSKTDPYAWFDSILSFFNAHVAKTGATASEAWVALHEDYIPAVPEAKHQKNFYQFLNQKNASPAGGCDGQTTAVWEDDYTTGQSDAFRAAISGKPAEGHRFSMFSRQIDNCAYFIVDPKGEGFWPSPSAPVTISVSYLDYYEGAGGTISDTISLEYWNGSSIVTAWTETKTEPSSGTWVTKTIYLSDFTANGSVWGYDFRINANGDGPEYVHMVTVQKYGGASGATATPTPTGGTPPTATPTATSTPTPGPWRLASNNSGYAPKVYAYDTLDDYRSNGWRTSTFSWWSETLDTLTRGVNRDFPEIAMIEGRGAQLWIQDPSAYNIAHASGRDGLWMAFQGGVLGTTGTTTNTINAVFAHEGLVCWGKNQTDSDGVVCADFPNDTFYRTIRSTTSTWRR